LQRKTPFGTVKILMETKTAIVSIDQLDANNVPQLRKTLEALPGVMSVDFGLERSVAVIEFDPQQSHIDDFLRAILKAGFKVL
jgi:copper chaperone CopZ